MDTIKPLTSILPVGSATSQGRGRSPNQQAPVSGQLLKAEVLEVRPENRFVLNIGGNRLTASSNASLTVGQNLQLQVVKTSPQIELKIISDTLNQFFGRSLTLIGKNIDLSSLFKAFQSYSPPPLDSLTPASKSVLEGFFTLQQSTLQNQDSGVVLKQLMDSLGLNLEQLLAKGDKNGAIHTLKAALLEIAHTFSSAETIAQTTSKILTNLELFQIIQLQVGSNDHFILPLPLPFIEQGYLVVERNGDDEKGEGAQANESRFSLHLTMSDIGNMSIDFLNNDEGLFIRFRAENQEKADFISQYTEELKAAISDVPLINITYSGDAPDPIHELVRQLVPKGSSMLDTKV